MTQADSHFEGQRQRTLNCLDMRLGRHTTNQSNDACNAYSGATSLELSTGRCTLCDFRAVLDKKRPNVVMSLAAGLKKTLVSRHTVCDSPGRTLSRSCEQRLPSEWARNLARQPQCGCCHGRPNNQPIEMLQGMTQS